MRKSISILFLSLYLLSTTQLSELMKVPVLVQHYHQHKVLNPELNFFSYLWLHYVKGSEKDADYDTDMRLPFKSNAKTINTQVNWVLSNPLNSWESPQRINYQSRCIIIPKAEYIPRNTYCANIWQPPRKL